MQREKYLAKMKADQEKTDAYKKQKEVLQEHKHINQMVDQMKINYYKEMKYDMKIRNKVGCEEFDKMAKTLKSVPDEFVQNNNPALLDKKKIQQRVNTLFCFTMSRYKWPIVLKPILSARNLAITAKESNEQDKKDKRRHSRGGSVAGVKVHQAYSNRANVAAKNNRPRSAKKSKVPQPMQNIFITDVEDKDDEETMKITKPKDTTPTVRLSGEPTKPMIEEPPKDNEQENN